MSARKHLKYICNAMRLKPKISSEDFLRNPLLTLFVSNFLFHLLIIPLYFFTILLQNLLVRRYEVPSCTVQLIRIPSIRPRTLTPRGFTQGVGPTTSRFDQIQPYEINPVELIDLTIDTCDLRKYQVQRITKACLQRRNTYCSFFVRSHLVQVVTTYKPLSEASIETLSVGKKITYGNIK